MKKTKLSLHETQKKVQDKICGGIDLISVENESLFCKI